MASGNDIIDVTFDKVPTNLFVTSVLQFIHLTRYCTAANIPNQNRYVIIEQVLNEKHVLLLKLHAYLITLYVTM